MKEMYSVERNVQILVGLLKANNIRKIVASPGTTNIPFVMSLQNDGGFEMYSCIDERSACYMACGMAAESGEPVVLTCTGATASRNYFSGLTEAFYRRLPILAVTSTRPLSHIGHLSAQVIDRTAQPNDIVKLSVFAPLVRCNDDEWDCQIKINQALDALSKDGGGPVHINLETESSFDFSVKELKRIRHIVRYESYNELPEIPAGNVSIFVGAHRPFTNEETAAVDAFCEKYNGVVLCDQTSNYRGKYRVLAAILGAQQQYLTTASAADLMINIGDLTGSYEMKTLMPKAKTVWRVAEDGVMRDASRSLSALFHMREIDFFSYYTEVKGNSSDTAFYNECRKDYEMLTNCIPDTLPLSNIWIASKLASKIPAGSVMHYAILNSLRAWNLFETPSTVMGYCNVGGFGIDGAVSSLIGASLCHPDKLYFGIVGDLAFFYDMNALGNRHAGRNLRLLIVNNGKGQEFRNRIHPASAYPDEMVDPYISAGGHYGNQSPTVVKDYAKNLGYEYLTAHTKEEFLAVADKFVTPSITEKSVVFEVFTEQDDENQALITMINLKKSADKMAINLAKNVIDSIVGKEGLETIKGIVRKR